MIILGGNNSYLMSPPFYLLLESPGWFAEFLQFGLPAGSSAVLLRSLKEEPSPGEKERPSDYRKGRVVLRHTCQTTEIAGLLPSFIIMII